MFMEKMTIEIHYDGACHNQKGQSSNMGIGVAVFINQTYQEDISRAIGVKADEYEDRGTSNVAEWIGCVEAMKMAADLKKFYKHAHIIIYSDSQIITNQFNGTYRITQEHFKKYYSEAHKHAKLAGVKEVRWIRREMNTQADKLSKEGIKLVTT